MSDTGHLIALNDSLMVTLCFFIYFRDKMKNLCEFEFCPSAKSCMYCDKFDMESVRTMCRSKSFSAIKVIRLNKLEDLQDIMTDKDMDVKILHLVRDPRGILASRLKLKQGDLTMQSSCLKMSHNVQTGILQTPSWMQGKYKMIRQVDSCYTESDQYSIICCPPCLNRYYIEIVT